MSYKTILVHVETGADSDRRVQLAADLAHQFEARLIGLAAGFPRPPMDYTGFGFSPELVDMVRDQIKADLETAEAQFRSLTSGAGLNTEWRASFDFPTQEMVHAATAADLLVVGSAKGKLLPDVYRSIDPGDLLMGVGRPVMVAPSGAAQLTERSVMIAWKDTMEARRALADALPFLKRAEDVVLLQVRESGERESADDATAFLAGHGVKVRDEAVKLDGTTVEAQIVYQAQAAKADLVVAGAYGHSRLREWVLGGVTRELLKNDGLACLLSH